MNGLVHWGSTPLAFLLYNNLKFKTYERIIIYFGRGIIIFERTKERYIKV